MVLTFCCPHSPWPGRCQLFTHCSSPALSTIADYPTSLSRQIPSVTKSVYDTLPVYPEPGHFDYLCCHHPGASPCRVNFGGHGSLLAFLCIMLLLSQQLHFPTLKDSCLPCCSLHLELSPGLAVASEGPPPMVFPSALGSVFSLHPACHCCLGLAQSPAPGLQVAAVGSQSSQKSFKVRWKPTCQPHIRGSLDTTTCSARSAPGCKGTEKPLKKLQTAKRMSLTKVQCGPGETGSRNKGRML